MITIHGAVQVMISVAKVAAGEFGEAADSIGQGIGMDVQHLGGRVGAPIAFHPGTHRDQQLGVVVRVVSQHRAQDVIDQGTQRCGILGQPAAGSCPRPPRHRYPRRHLPLPHHTRATRLGRAVSRTVAGMGRAGRFRDPCVRLDRPAHPILHRQCGFHPHRLHQVRRPRRAAGSARTGNHCLSSDRRPLARRPRTPVPATRPRRFGQE